MLSLFYDLPGGVAGTLFALGSMALSLGGMVALRPLFHRWIHTQDKLNEMVSLNIASFSLFYGIMLGLVAVGAYTDYVSTKETVEREASTLSALYSDTRALPEPSRTQLLNELRDYARETIETDWPAQAQGKVPSGGTQRLVKFQQDLLATKPTSRSEEVAYAEAFGQLEKLTEQRSTRLNRVSSESPAILWWVIIVGAILTIGVIWMLDMAVHIHGVLTAVLSLFLGVVFYFVLVMDKPFRGHGLLTPEPYELVYHQLMKAS